MTVVVVIIWWGSSFSLWSDWDAWTGGSDSMSEEMSVNLYGIHIPCHCRCLSLVDGPQCNLPVVDWFELVGVGGGLFFAVSPRHLVFWNRQRRNVPISGNRHTGSGMQAGCRSPFMWVFPIAISAPVLLGAFAWPLSFMRDFVGYCINGCGRFCNWVGVF